MLAALVIYGFVLLLLFIFQRNLQYHPLGKVGKISDYFLAGFVEKNLTTSDNEKILAWYKPAPNKAKLIIYFHGNAGNIGDRAHRFSTFSDAGFGVLAISYRGYSGSEGSPSEAGLLKDGEAAIQFALTQNYRENDLIFYGESLGSGIAVQLATRFNPHALILESPYASIAGVAQQIYWFVPVKLLLKDKFESEKFAPRIVAPTLIFHGTKDEVVPYFQGQKLFAAINSKKEMITVEGAGHLEFGDQFLVENMMRFLTEVAQ